MKATFEFDLTEYKDEYEIFRQASEMYLVLVDMQDWLRSEIKYGNKQQFTPVQEKLYQLLTERRVDIDY